MVSGKLGKIGVVIMILSLFSETFLVFSPKTAFAQSGGSSGGSVQSGFNAGGLLGGAAGSAVACTNLAGKLNQLIGGTTSTSTVPTNDPSNDLRENCLKKITKDIVNKILDKITLATVDWINSGFSNGGPLWVQDPGQFFGDIARKEINSVTGWYSTNPLTYPFGKMVMTQVLISLQRQAQQNLQFSLNQVLAHGTYEDFRVNFNVGGWAGYTAFLEPQNNPFGNDLLIRYDLGRRTGGTTLNIGKQFNEQLSQSGGYLSPRVCAISGTGSDDYIPETNDLHLGEYFSVLAPGSTLGDVTFAQLPGAVQGELDDFGNAADQADAYNSLVLRSRCKQWKATTPGQVIGTRLTKGLDTSQDQLIAADDFAENIGLIFDALINQLIKTGLKELGSSNNNSVLLAQVNGQQPGAVANGQANPPVINVINGTGPAGIADLPLLEVQDQYIENAEEALDLLNELTAKIRALDYCVPGPNPRWLEAATTNFQTALAGVGAASSSNPISQNEAYYRNRIHDFTGATIVESPAMYNHTQFVNFMQEVFNRYRDRMLANYSPDSAPPSTRFFLESLFTDMDVYNGEVTSLTQYLANITPLLPTIQSIQDELAAIAAANNGVLNPSNPQVQVQVSIFNSISDNLATQTQLNTLVSRMAIYEAQIGLLNTHLNSCIAETVTNPYTYPNSRVPYPAPAIFPYPGLPNSNQSFLPGIGFGGGTSNINIEINGVSVMFSSNNLSTFESILQTIY